MYKDFKSLAELVLVLPTEEAAIAHFTAIRWANGEFCPYCGCKKIAHQAKISQMF